ncbi:hypothetical protein OUZ56_005553 [Daphnia magna]|uniref:Uncharacterized protein n=1 Tax=Daphnia magna TaxID=35525 RepID=A0ABQ9YT41_9CRUS|nr:hypothetical protein OUZ56_005553 [Daphnia magna]
MSDSLQYVKWGWVSALSGIHLPNVKVLVKAAVPHSQSLRKKEVTPWVAIHPNKSIIAAHCPCTTGIIYAMNVPCTAQENKWLDTHTKHHIGLIHQLCQLNTSQSKNTDEEEFNKN